MKDKRNLRHENVHQLWFGHHFIIIKFHSVEKETLKRYPQFILCMEASLRPPTEAPGRRPQAPDMDRPVWGPGPPTSGKTTTLLCLLLL